MPLVVEWLLGLVDGRIRDPLADEENRTTTNRINALSCFPVFIVVIYLKEKHEIGLNRKYLSYIQCINRKSLFLSESAKEGIAYCSREFQRELNAVGTSLLIVGWWDGTRQTQNSKISVLLLHFSRSIQVK